MPDMKSQPIFKFMPGMKFAIFHAGHENGSFPVHAGHETEMN